MASPLDSSLAELAQVSRIARVVSFLRTLLLRPDPVKVLRHREALVKEIREHLPDVPGVLRDTGKEPPEIMLIPQSSYRKMSSDDLEYDDRLMALRPWHWNKLGVAALDQERGALGVYLGLPIRVHINSRGTAREVWSTDGDVETRTIRLFGWIPLERITHIDWYEATVYQTPRVYANFRWRSPIKEVVVCDFPRDDDEFQRYQPVECVKRFKPHRWHRINAFKFEWNQRKQNKQRKKELDG